MAEPDQQQGSRVSALSVLGVEFGRHSGAYMSASGIGLGLALVQIAIVTRYLDPSAFGQLALLLLLAALLTIAYNLGILQGTFARVYGSAGEDEVEDDAEQALAGRKREALGTGLSLIALVALLGTLLLVPLAGPLASVLVRDSGDSGLVLLAIGSGAMGALWRLVHNIPRMERRPRQYVWLTSVRPVLVLTLVAALVAGGGGVEGVLIGTLVGTALSVALGLYVIRASWVPNFELAEAKSIYGRGIYLVPIIVSFWIVQNVDVFALSRYVDDADVGIYRLAGRIAAIASYVTSAFFLAWVPLRRAASFAAAREERGRELEGTLLTYFIVLSAGLLVAMTVAADLLVKIAPPAYGSAAPLVPLLGGAFLAHGLLVATYRTSSFPDRRPTYIAVVVASVGIFTLAAMALIPRFGTYGAALAVIAAFLPGAGWIAFRSQFGPKPITISARRLLATLLVTVICLLGARAAADLDGVAHTAIQVLALAAFGPMLVLTGAVPRRDLASLLRIVRSLIGRPRLLGIEHNLGRLDHRAEAELLAAASEGDRLAALAKQVGREPRQLASDCVRRLRTLSDEEAETFRDGAIGMHLLIPTTLADYDSTARRLLDLGASAQDLGRLELALRELRAIPDDAWPPAVIEEREALLRAAADHADGEGDATATAVIARELREVGRARAKAMIAEEKSFGEHVRYVLHDPGVDSDALVVGFASTRPGTPDRYSYVGPLTREDCSTLFLRVEGGAFHGTAGNREIDDELDGCIELVREQLGVERANVICCGGSAGGIRALGLGLEMGYGHVVAGAPLILIGDFMMGPSRRQVFAETVKAITGKEDPDPAELNELMLRLLREPAGETCLHISISERDQIFRFSVPALREACEASERLTLDLTLADYEGHREHKDSFRPYLEAKVSELLEEINSSAPASAS